MGDYFHSKFWKNDKVRVKPCHHLLVVMAVTTRSHCLCLRIPICSFYIHSTKYEKWSFSKTAVTVMQERLVRQSRTTSPGIRGFKQCSCRSCFVSPRLRIGRGNSLMLYFRQSKSSMTLEMRTARRPNVSGAFNTEPVCTGAGSFLFRIFLWLPSLLFRLSFLLLLLVAMVVVAMIMSKKEKKSL